ncbi:26S proteasome regulatory subunit 6A, partial [Pestalotiopsis sp. IQ-011]
MEDKLNRLKAKASEDVERTKRGQWHSFLDEPHDEISTPTLARFFRESEDSANVQGEAVGEQVADEAVTDNEPVEPTTGIPMTFADEIEAILANVRPPRKLNDKNNVARIDFAGQEGEESREAAAEEGIREEDEEGESAEGENYEEDSYYGDEENEGYHSNDGEKSTTEVMRSDPEMAAIEARKHAEEVAQTANEKSAEEETEYVPGFTQKEEVDEVISESTKKAMGKLVEQRVAVDVQPEETSAAAEEDAEAETSDDAFDSISIEPEEDLVAGLMAKPASPAAPVEEALAEPAAGASIEEATAENDIKSAPSLTEQPNESATIVHSEVFAAQPVAEDNIDFANSPGALEPVDWFRSMTTNKTNRSFIIESDSDLEQMEQNFAESEFKGRKQFPLPGIRDGEKSHNPFSNHFEEEDKPPPENQDLPPEPFLYEDTYEDYIYHGFYAITIGDLIAGRYQVFRKIGSGGHGTVWLVHDKELSRWRALKVLSTPKSGEHCPDRRFARLVEAKGLSVEELERRHITFPYDMFEIQSSPGRKNLCLVMPLMGPDLLSIRQWEPVEMRRIFYELAGSLEFLHQNSICHGDYRTSNLLLCLDQDDLHSISVEEMENRLPEPITRQSENLVFMANHPRVPSHFTKKTDLDWLGVKFTGHAAVVDFGGAHEVPDPGAWAGIPPTWAAPEAYWQLSASLPADVWALATTIAEVYTDARFFNGGSDDEIQVGEYEFVLGALPQPYRRAYRKRMRRIKAIELGNAQKLGHDQELKSGEVHSIRSGVEETDASSVPGTGADEHLDDAEDCSQPVSLSLEDLIELQQNTFEGDGKQSSIIRSMIGLPWSFELVNLDFPYHKLTSENRESLLEEFPTFEVKGSIGQKEIDILGDLLERVLRYQPEDRLTISEVLKHDWFAYNGEDQAADEDGVVEDNNIQDNAAEDTTDGDIEELIDELIEDYSVENDGLVNDEDAENDSEDEIKDEIVDDAQDDTAEDEIIAGTNNVEDDTEQDIAHDSAKNAAADNNMEDEAVEGKAAVLTDEVDDDVGKDSIAAQEDSKDIVAETNNVEQNAEQDEAHNIVESTAAESHTEEKDAEDEATVEGDVVGDDVVGDDVVGDDVVGDDV